MDIDACSYSVSFSTSVLESLFPLYQGVRRRAVSWDTMLLSAALSQQWTNTQLCNCWQSIWWFSIPLHLQNMYPKKADSTVGSTFLLMPLQEVGAVPLISVRMEMVPKADLDDMKSSTFLWALISSCSLIITLPLLHSHLPSLFLLEPE